MVKNYLSGLPKNTLNLVKAIGQIADEHHVAAYIVGGTVRDIILKNKNVDLDITIEGDAVAFAKHLTDQFKAKMETYSQFATATLYWPDGRMVDLATARRESYPHCGALPVVEPARLREDLARRDFTINALALAINKDRFGELVDYFGGLKDLQNKHIRVLHDQSFVDDPTRILRAVRFEQRLKFVIEKHTLSLLKEALRKKVTQNVKPPRYLAEFKKFASESRPEKAYERLKKLAGFQFIGLASLNYPALKRIIVRLSELKGDALYKGKGQDWLIHFLGLIEGASASKRIILSAKFNFSRENRLTTLQAYQKEIIFKQISKCRHQSDVYDILKPLTIGMIIYLRASSQKGNAAKAIDRFLSRDVDLKLYLNGDLLKKMGMSSGKEMGEVLKAILHEKIDHHIHTKTDEINAARKIIKSKPKAL